GFQGAGKADSSVDGDPPGTGDALELPASGRGSGGSGSGAVVVSGAREAGGGSEESVADAGNGASLFGAPGFADPVTPLCAPCASLFFLLTCCCATGKAG